MSNDIRKPAVAGQFYDADPISLKRHIEKFKSGCTPDAQLEDKTVRAVIMPHAGYVYSGETAVKTLFTAREGNYDKAVILAPSHRVPLKGVALCDYEGYDTPLDTLAIDLKAVEQLKQSRSQNISTSNEAHAYEHALEVELPILQSFFDDIRIVPLICGHVDPAMAEELAEIFSALWQPNVLWIISSDFTHYGHAFSYVPFTSNIKDNLRKLDLGAAEKITRLDLKGFDEYLDKTGATICGSNPIKILLSVINKANAAGESIKGQVVDYTTSGELSGDFSHCVSYTGITFYAD